MRSPVRSSVTLFLALAASLLTPALLLSEDGTTHGWRRSGGGFWGSRPEIHAGFSEKGIALEMTLPPGTDVAYSRDGSWASDNASLLMTTEPAARGGNEYFPGEAKFPASVTFVYGRDSLPMGKWERAKLFFRKLRHGFRPPGIRLTYAWGTGVPVGSMYRLWEEETVFILAGREDAGKKISAVRSLAGDFQAAYGRPPKGPVTKVLVEAEGSSGGKRPANTSITVRFPPE